MSYLGTQPNDVKKNTGLYTPSEILQLEKDGNWGGSLELIAEQTFSTTQFVDFTSIKESIYDVHFLQFFLTECTGALITQISNDGGSSFIATNYQRAGQYGSVGGTFGEDRSTSTANLADFGTGGTNLGKNGYVYFYNLNNSSKYSFATFQSFNEHPSLTHYMNFGGGVYPTAETHNAIRLSAITGTSTGNAKLYGVKQI
jgi:hypothetical protein